jgi:hypothetical protein
VTDDLLTVVCTDRGQHPRRRLWLGTADGATALREPGHADAQSWHRDGGMRFWCRTCRRDVQLTAATWERLVAGLAAAGVSVLDVSMLPY